MGMIVDVYTKSGGDHDSTNGGISSEFTTFCVMNVEGPFEPKSNCPPVLLVTGELSITRGIVKIVPAVKNESGVYVPLKRANACGPMFGGNYASTSDSRFTKACEKLMNTRFYGAVAIHDRFEY